MAKYRDKFPALVKPRTMKKRRREGFRARHSRRRVTALSQEDTARQWAAESGVTFRIANGGHHWMFTLSDDPPQKHFAQWWPQTAKLVFWHRYDQAIHAHEIAQVIAEMDLVMNHRHRKVHRRPKDWAAPR